MKNHFLTLSLLACSCILLAQNENPFSQFGYEAPVMQVKEQPAMDTDTLFIVENQNPSSDIRWLVIDTKNQLIRLYSAEGIEVGNENLLSYTIARWLVPDPAGQYYSPYMGMGNNWMIGIDPDGRLWLDEITIGEDGTVTNVIKNNQPNRFFDETTGEELFFGDATVVDNMWLKPGMFSVGDRVYFPINNNMLSEAINNAGNASNWLQLIIKSNSEADFTLSYLVKNYFKGSEPSFLEDGAFRTHYQENFHYFRFNNEKTIYNLYDAGNYMWGCWMHQTGWSYETARFGSRANEIWRDTNADQNAIKAGYNNFYW